jgi:hypothetical protein
MHASNRERKREEINVRKEEIGARLRPRFKVRASVSRKRAFVLLQIKYFTFVEQEME